MISILSNYVPLKYLERLTQQQFHILEDLNPLSVLIVRSEFGAVPIHYWIYCLNEQ
jgi:hypothetical protein